MSDVAASRPDDLSVQELVALEEKWIHAGDSHDAGTLRTILDERFIAISGSGVQSREESIADVTQDGLPLEFAVRVTPSYRRNGKWRAFAVVFSEAPPPR